MRRFGKLPPLAALILLTAMLLVSCFGSEAGSSITSLSFSRTGDIILDGETEKGYLRIEGSQDADTSDFMLISENESVATAKFTTSSGYLVSFEVTPIGVGETYIYAATADGTVTSEKIKVVVTGSSLQSQTEAETTAEQTTELAFDTYPLTKPADTDPAESETTEEYYVLNTNTKKIHRKHCSSVKKISSKNYATTDDLQSKLDEGYVWCKICG